MRTVGELLQARPSALHAVAPGAAVIDAIRMMDAHDIGAVLVMEGEALVGLFTERDYARKIMLRGRSSVSTTVGEVMSSEVVSVTPTAALDECRRLLAQRRFRHLPVLEQGRVLGMVTIGDLW